MQKKNACVAKFLFYQLSSRICPCRDSFTFAASIECFVHKSKRSTNYVDAHMYVHVVTYACERYSSFVLFGSLTLQYYVFLELIEREFI